MAMETVRSEDGTTIAFERSGAGPPLVLVLGAFNDRRSKPELAALLADHFTVVTYDRRGRGGSGDTPPYAIEREIEDLAAVIGATATATPGNDTGRGRGTGARVFGHSSGAVLALRAAAAGVPIAKLAGYDPPVAVLDGTPAPGDLAARIAAEVAAGRRGAAAALFLAEAVGLPGEVVAMIEAGPGWPALEAIAHTLPYDVTITGAALSPALLATVAVPTLVVDGGANPVFLQEAAATVATAVPDAKHVTLPGQTHDEDPEVLAPVLVEFLA
jgi:pimeloyl-ACP methyl ester carboxylesterase